MKRWVLFLVPATMLLFAPGVSEGSGYSIVAWGWNEFGQCDVPEPNEGFVSVESGDLYSIGLKDDGSIVAWGSNEFGQCDVPSPNTDIVVIAGGGDHSICIKQDGSIVAWGVTSMASAMYLSRIMIS